MSRSVLICNGVYVNLAVENEATAFLNDLEEDVEMEPRPHDDDPSKKLYTKQQYRKLKLFLLQVNTDLSFHLSYLTKGDRISKRKWIKAGEKAYKEIKKFIDQILVPCRLAVEKLWCYHRK